MSVSVLLAVDDRPDNLFVLKQLMETYLPEIKMITAESADAGLALAATETIDGALIDVQIPGMNGIEMCRRLKSDPRTAPIHVILVTAPGAPPELKSQGLKAGADDFISKPIDNVELAAKLRAILRLRSPEDALCRECNHLEKAGQEHNQALQEAENRYRALFQTAGDAIFINDLEGGLLEVNEEACRLLGYTREELLLLKISDLVTPENAARRPDLLKQLQATDVLVFEMELVSHGKRIIHTECKSRMIDLQGHPAVLSIARDISERKATEVALRESEGRYRELFEKNSDATMIFDAETHRFEDGNAAALSLYGYTREEFLAVTVEDISAEPDVTRALIPRLVTGEAGPRIPLRYQKKKDGTVVPVEIAAGVCFAGGRRKIIGAVRDITERKMAEEALRASEELYRSLFEHMLNGLAYCKMIFEQNQPQDFIYLSVNRTFETLTGLKNVVGKRVSEVIPGLRESDPELFEIYGRVALTGKSERFETFVEAMQMWFSISVYSPEKEYFVAIFNEITDRKRAEALLRESETKYRRLIESLQEGVWQIDQDGCTNFVNQRMADMLGFTVDEILGKHLFELMDEAGVEIVKRNLERRQRGIKEQHEFEFIRKDGSRIYTIMETGPITDETGHYIGEIAGVQNITLRKQAEEKLRRSEERYRILVENILDGLLIFSLPKGRILYVNRQISKIFGYNRQQWLRLSLRDLIIPEEKERLHDLVQKQTQGENHAAVSQIFTGRRRDASTFLVEVAIAPLTFQEKLAGQGIIRDVSERERLRQHVHYAQRMQALGTLVAGIAHKIRTPLTVCSSAAQFIRDDDLTPEFRRQCLEKILSGIAKASDIIENLLTFAPPPENVEAIRMNLGAIIRDTLALVANQAKRQNVELRWADPVAPIYLFGLAGLLPQAFLRLFSNALSAMPDGGILSVSLEGTGQEEVITITDTGPGIAATDLPYIFDPFFTTTATGQGTGLGLSVCYAIIKQHSGSIEAESTAGQGARFTVRLPGSPGSG
jgi:PAS domain S-box-containing protein